MMEQGYSHQQIVPETCKTVRIDAWLWDLPVFVTTKESLLRYQSRSLFRQKKSELKFRRMSSVESSSLPVQGKSEMNKYLPSTYYPRWNERKFSYVFAWNLYKENTSI
jgi:hypothetical protein